MNSEQQCIMDSLQICFPVIKPLEIWCLQDRKGRTLKLLSGKSKWNKQGHVKTALRRHIYTLFRNIRKPLTSEKVSEIIHQMIDCGEIRIVRIFPEDK